MPDTLDISIVVPAYNEEESLPELCRWIFEVLRADARSFELLFIDDGSADSTWQVIQQLAAQHPEVKGYRLSEISVNLPPSTSDLKPLKGRWSSPWTRICKTARKKFRRCTA
ncbi:glycosyl transferase family protein [Nitritalea halalkaliphila LW7]|uniref:Glycosyl transferase family protein n=1 Tax=Nitritalea halalkaliphila LW7 TaxID=1189621 RepID=I5C0M4_9BACT|nr:glycosyl transferase family protein [Nitritalea halalkaliphila LW7]